MLASYRIYKTDTITRAVLISHLWQNLILLYLQQKLSFPLCLSKKHSEKLLFYLSNSLTMKKISLLILLICYQLFSYAQGILKGKIVDSATKKPLGLATVTIYKAVDTSIIVCYLYLIDHIGG